MEVVYLNCGLNDQFPVGLFCTNAFQEFSRCEVVKRMSETRKLLYVNKVKTRLIGNFLFATRLIDSIPQLLCNIIK